MGENNNSDNDVTEVSQRLKAVSNGAATQEFTLRRNQLGQLGFHVQVRNSLFSLLSCLFMVGQGMAKSGTTQYLGFAGWCC